MMWLTEEDCERIHEASLTVLEEVGCRFDDDSVCELLKRAGAQEGSAHNVLRIPHELVEESLGRCPSTVRIADRTGRREELGPRGGTVFWTGNALHTLEGDRRRPIQSDDLTAFARLIEACENVDAAVGTNMEDYPAAARDFVGLRIMADATRKHLRPCIYTPTGAKAIVEMAEVLAGGTPLGERPLVSFGYSIVSPLRWAETACVVFRNTSGKKIPIMINAEPLAGGTSPVTLAGCLVAANADALSGVVMAQHLEPERPVVFNIGFAHVMDMRAAQALTGSPENAILQSAGAELARFHGLPSASWMSADSPILDTQAAIEKTLTCLAHVSAGVNIVWGAGNLEATLCFSPEALIVDDELIGAVKRYARGFEVNDETMALDVIKEVGLSGDFLSTEHTLKHFRSQIWDSKLFFRARRAAWEAAGGTSLGERAAQRVKEILDAPFEPCLSDDQRAELERIERRYLAEVNS